MLGTISSVISVGSFLKDIYNTVDKKREIERLYDKALKQWARNEPIRKDQAKHCLRDFRRMIDFFTGKLSEELLKGEKELLELFITELYNASSVSEIITREQLLQINQTLQGYNKNIESKIDATNDVANSNNKLLLQNQEVLLDNKDEHAEIKELILEVKSSIEQDPALLNPYEGPDVLKYIRRTVKCYDNSIQDEENAAIFDLDVTAYPLRNYIVGIQNSRERYHYVLYSTAQFGKTTELVHLAYELSGSKDYIPFLVKLKDYPDLTREYLPTNHILNGKQVVLLIDAVDEMDAAKREDLVRILNSYSETYPQIRILVSCRNNFKQSGTLENYTELFLEGLSSPEAEDLIRELSDEPERVIENLKELSFSDIMQSPFFLKTFINYCRDNAEVAKDKAQLLDYFIKTAIQEERTGITNTDVSAAYTLINKVAVLMQLTGTTSISEDQLVQIENRNQVMTKCLRSRIFSRQGQKYTFEQAAFKEYFVAKYLCRLSNLDEVRSLITYQGTKTVMKEWYNTVLLYVDMKVKEDRYFALNFTNWLVEDNAKMIVYADEIELADNIRTSIVKSIFQECKKNGVSIHIHDYYYARYLMKFGATDDIVLFLLEELKDVNEIDGYISSVLECIKYINFKRYIVTCKLDVKRQVIERVFNIITIDSTSHGSYYALYDSLENDVFLNHECLEKLREIAIDSHNEYLIDAYFEMLVKLDVADQYFDDIVLLESRVVSYTQDGVTHCVGRSAVSEVFNAVGRYENLIKTYTYISKEAKDENARYSVDDSILDIDDSITKKIFDCSYNPIQELTNLLDIAVDNKELVYTYQDFDIKRQELLSRQLLQCNQDIVKFIQTEIDKLLELKKSDKKLFDKQTVRLFYVLDKPVLDVVIQEFRNGKFSREQMQSLKFIFSPDITLAIQVLFDDEVEREKKRIEKQKADFEVLFSVDKFYDSIVRLNNQERFEGTKDVFSYFRNAHLQENLFLRSFYNIGRTAEKGKIDLDVVEKFSKDKVFVNQYLVSEYYDHVGRSDLKIELSGDKKDIINKIVEENLSAWIAGNGYEYRFDMVNKSIKLVLMDFVQISDETLLKLLPYSDIGNSFNQRHRILFEIIQDKVGQEVLDKHLKNLFTTNAKHNPYNVKVFASYVFRYNKTNLLYDFLTYVTTNYVDQIPCIMDVAFDSNLSGKMNIIKILLEYIDDENKFTYIHAFKLQEEFEYKTLILSQDIFKYVSEPPRHLIQLLLELHDEAILDYLYQYKDKLSRLGTVILPYNDVKYLDQLAKLLVVLTKSRHGGWGFINSLSDCIVNIAASSKENLNTVMTLFDNLIDIHDDISDSLIWRKKAIYKAYLDKKKTVYTFSEALDCVKNMGFC